MSRSTPVDVITSRCRYSDVVFSVEERKFYGHKLILGAGSATMRHMFLDAKDNSASRPSIRYSRGKSEEGVTLIMLPDIKAAVFEQVLRLK